MDGIGMDMDGLDLEGMACQPSDDPVMHQDFMDQPLHSLQRKKSEQ